MRLKKSVKELITFGSIVSKIKIEDTKLGRMIGKQSKVISKALEFYYEKVEAARIDYCSVDKDGNVIISNKDYVFSRDNMKLLNVELSRLLNEEIEIEILLNEGNISTATNGFKSYLSDFIELNEAECCDNCGCTSGTTTVTLVVPESLIPTASTPDPNAVVATPEQAQPVATTPDPNAVVATPQS